MEYEIRTELHDLVITAIQDVEYKDSTEKLFDNVVKYPEDIFDGYICSVQYRSRSIVERNLDYDKQSVGFRLVFGQLIETNANQEALDVKTDLLGNTEDRLYNTLEKVPNLFDGKTSNFIVTQVTNINSIPLVQTTNRGVEITMDIEFDVIVDIPVKIIT